MLTDKKRSEERTGVQTSVPYGGRWDLQSDFVMIYRLNDTTVERINQYRDRGYIVHLMTGVSWGDYHDYLNGEFDGENHWDEAQTRIDGEKIIHGKRNPYLIPSIAFADYLSEKLRIAVDAGVEAIHLEEPEIWVFAGYSDAFKREYELYYKEPWRPPHESADAYYRANKLKAYLYTRTIGHIADKIKEYVYKKHGRTIRIIIPTHSVINYTQYGISSPESMLLDLPGIDGYIAQVWSDTSRVPNVYKGEKRQRVFEVAFLEYGAMQELTRGTNRSMYFLQDPVSDRRDYSWDYYRACYIEGLIAALLQPYVSKYEICPWPHRLINEEYAGGEPIPEDYLTIILSATQVLRDMDQPHEWLGGDSSAGVIISDTMMYQRTYGYGYNPGIKYAEFGEESNLSGFYGLALPLLMRGIRTLPVQLENIRRIPGYLDGYEMLCLSYEFMKPESPDVHYALAEWVNRGGALILVGDGSDPFNGIRHWWNQGTRSYTTPMQHLTDALGLGRTPAAGLHKVGKGCVAIMPVHPAHIAYHASAEDEYITLLNECRAAVGLPSFRMKNYFALRRGPYIIAASMKDSKEPGSFQMSGRFVDLLSPDLAVLDRLSLKPGEYRLVADVDCYDLPVCLIGSAGRVENYIWVGNTVSFDVHGPTGAKCVLRFKGPRPTAAELEGKPLAFEYDDFSGTFLLRMDGTAEGVHVRVIF